MKQGKVCVFGSFNLDIVAGMARFPQPGESLIAHSSTMGAGGKGANQAIAALRAGARVHYIGKIGRDEFGIFARRHLESAGFDAVTLFTSHNAPTGNALIYVAGAEAENMIAVDPGANLTISDDEVAQCRPAIAAADILLTQLENNIAAIEEVIAIARQSGTYIILNPAPYQAVPYDLLAQVDLLTPNATECTLLSGVHVCDIPSAQRAAQVLHTRGVKQVLITLGTQGALLSQQRVSQQRVSQRVSQQRALQPRTSQQEMAQQEESPPPQVQHIAAYPAVPQDTTGAGDAFNGALAAQLAAGVELAAAAQFASAYAAVAVERVGAANAMPSYQEAYARFTGVSAATSAH